MLPVLTPTDFVALTNQTLELAYPGVEIEGEVLNFKVSRGRWVYFDIADEFSKIRCFGTVYMLPAPVEDGMKVHITAAPRLHPQFGFSLNLSGLRFSGEGTIKKASDLLKAKLEAEGLFAPERKRLLPFPPKSIGLITSDESAGYKDFIKIIDARYGGIKIELASVQVQGEPAPGQIVRAIEWFNKQADIVDVLVLVRGGGSADDLQAFSTEQVTRAVAASRIPTLVAIGHEQDISLAELAADRRASTPSNAAELLVPDRREQLEQLKFTRQRLDETVLQLADRKTEELHMILAAANERLTGHLSRQLNRLEEQKRTLKALSPQAVLERGYAVVRSQGKVVKSAADAPKGKLLDIQLASANLKAKVE